MSAQYMFLIVCGLLIYAVATDENIATAFFYGTKLVSTNIRKHWWWLLNNPKNPVVKYLIYRRSLRLAKELTVEINKEKET